MAKQNHDVLLIGGAGAAAFGAYQWIYKPWKAAKDAAAAAASLNTGTPLYSTPTGGGTGGPITPYVTTPTNLTPAPITPSNLNPGAAVGGPVGTMMARKGWTQAQAQARYDALQGAYKAAVQQLATIQSGGSLAEANATIAANQNAIAQISPLYNAAVAAGDLAAASGYMARLTGHRNDIEAINGRIAGLNNQITALKNAIAGYQSDYQALTGQSLG